VLEVFILSHTLRSPDLFVYGCDYAPTAVELVRKHPAYVAARCHAFVCDVAYDDVGLPDGSLDLVLLIFALSALQPSECDWRAEIHKHWSRFNVSFPHPQNAVGP
jgi:hypothetical protein